MKKPPAAGSTGDDASKQALRQQAEAQFARLPETLAASSPEEIQKALHELRVHQIELEMQNEELRTAQAELDASQARYFDLYELAPVGYCTLSEAGLILEANLTATTLLGVARRALVQQPFSRFICKDDQSAYYLHRRQLLASGPPQAFDLRMVKPDGTGFWAHLTAATVQNDDGAPTCRIAFSDITERKQAEEKLRQSEDKFSKAFRISSYAILLTHVEDGRFIEVNDAFTAFTGYTRAEALADSSIGLKLWVHAEDRARLVSTLRTGNAVFSQECQFRTKTGTILTCLYSAVLVQLGPDTCILSSIADITARKQGEDRLRFQAQMLDSVRESVVASDLEGRILYWGRGAEALYGYTAAEVLNRPYRDFAGAIEPPDETAFRRRILAQGSWRGEHLQKRKNGETFWTSTLISVVDDEHGQPAGFIGIDQDITERKQVEAALRESAERFRQVAETAEEWIWEMDAAGVYTYSNPVVETILGYPPEELVGRKNFLDLFAPEVREEIRREAAGRAARQEGFLKRVNPVLHKDGHVVFLETSGAPIVDAQGRLTGYRGADTDVTARLRMETALRESEARSQSILNASPDGIVIIDLEGRARMVSPRAAAMFGRKPEEDLRGRLATEFLVPEDRERALANIVRTVQGTILGPIEYRARRADGSLFAVEVNSQVIRNVQNQPESLVLIVRDVTERKQAEEQLRDSERRFKLLFESMSSGFALHEIILDEAGTPCDYRFLQVNPAFETLTGLKADALIGRTVREVLPRTEPVWIERYGRVALTGEPVTFENYSVELGRHYQVTAYRPQPGQFAVLVGDVTERMRAAEDLQRKQAMLARTEALAHVGSWEWDVATDTVIWSDELFRIFRRDPAQGAPSFAEQAALYPPDDFRRLNEAVAAALRDGTPYELELHALCLDGVVRTCHVHGQADKKDGRVVHLSGSLQDITDRKQAEEALRQSEEKFAQVFRTSPYAVALTQAENGRFIDVNPAFATITGFSREEALADSSIGLGLWVHSEDRQRVTDDLRQGVPVLSRECAIRTKSGRVVTALFSAQFLRLGDERIILSSLNDISDRKQAEDALRESERRHRDYLVHSPYGIFVSDEQGRFVQVNPAASRITGYSEKELLSKSIPDLQSEDGREDSVRHFQTLLREGKATGELKFRTKSGEIRWWLISAVKLSDVRFLGFCNDITDRKQAEEKLQASAERFRDIAANIPGAIYQLQTGRTGALEVPYMSSGCEALFGRPLAGLDFTGLLFDHMHVGDRTLFELSLAKAAQHVKRWNLDFRVATPEGTNKWLRGSANPRATPPGGVLWNGVFLDITPLKQAEEREAATQALLRLVLDRVPAYICAKNLAGRFLLVNRKLADFYGRPVAAMTGSLHADFCEDQEELRAMLAADREVIESGQIKHVPEETMKNPDGSTTVLETYKIPFTANNEPAVLVTATDVTERKRAETKILQESLFNKTIIDSVPGTFYMLDEAGNYLRWSTYQQEQIVGQPDEGMRQTNALATIHPDDRDLIRTRIENVLKNGVEEVVEGRVLLRGGPDFRWFLMTGRRMVVDGRPALIGMGIDITERKAAELQVARQLDELRRWQTVTLGREGRVAELKREVNAHAVRLGQPPPYPSAEEK